jgi:class 3 adenylate cyclase
MGRVRRRSVQHGTAPTSVDILPAMPNALGVQRAGAAHCHAELPEGTVTILFTDVVGSTGLTNRLGDDDAREILGACDELVRRQV